MKKKIGFGVLAAVLLVAGVYLVGTGLTRRTDVHVAEYTLSEDGKTMSIIAGVSGPMGYIRDVAVRTDAEKVYLTFFSAFGGLNSRLGARNQFEFPISDAATQIYVYRGESGDELILQKNPENSQWEWVNPR